MVWLTFRDEKNKLVLRKRRKLETHTEEKYNSLLERDAEKYDLKFGKNNWRYASKEEVDHQNKISNQVSKYIEPEDI